MCFRSGTPTVPAHLFVPFFVFFDRLHFKKHETDDLKVFTVFMLGPSGTDVTILKIFSPKTLAKNLAFLTKSSVGSFKQNASQHWFSRKEPIFSHKNRRK
jgi:hypothetical protein